VRRLRAVAQVTRLDTSILACLAVVIPHWSRDHFDTGVRTGVPILLITMCTFIANDLDDIERDRINHPNRPLPSARLQTSTAALLYFICLGLALLATRAFVPYPLSFWYYGLASIAISYRYVTEYLPVIKAPYVAAALTVPIVLVSQWFSEEPRLLVVAAAFFLAALARELCMDVHDRAGDPHSAVTQINARRLVRFAFVLQGFGLALLGTGVGSILAAIDLAGMLLLSLTAYQLWFHEDRQELAIRLMKWQFFAGLLFLA
jgi:geranylgeranylglycerol-phosphate geranylgeranyltransferase